MSPYVRPSRMYPGRKHDLPAPGRRGFQSFVPPPKGCDGWQPDPTESRRTSATPGSDDAHSRSLSPTATEDRSKISRPASSRRQVSTGEDSVRRQAASPFDQGNVSVAAALTALPISLEEAPSLLQSNNAAGTRPVSAHTNVSNDADAEVAGLLSPLRPQSGRSRRPSHVPPANLEMFSGPLYAAHQLKASLSSPTHGLATKDILTSPVRDGDAEIITLRARDHELGEILDGDGHLLTECAPARHAMVLYADTIVAFDPAIQAARKAFQAVAKDDADALQEILNGGELRYLTARNSAGQTLLEVASERRRTRVAPLLQVECARAERAFAAYEAKRRNLEARSGLPDSRPQSRNSTTQDATRPDSRQGKLATPPVGSRPSSGMKFERSTSDASSGRRPVPGASDRAAPKVPGVSDRSAPKGAPRASPQIGNRRSPMPAIGKQN